MSSALTLNSVDAGYRRVKVLDEISLTVERGSIVAIVGRNGAGKSTLLGVISGLLRAWRGSVQLNDRDVTALSAPERVGLGLRHVAEGRRLFRSLTVAENLDLGLYSTPVGRAERAARRSEVSQYFPVLGRKSGAPAGVLSGGEQQMLAIAQALMSRPSVILLDEPSLGLAPSVTEAVFAVLEELRSQGQTVVLVEQMVEQALELADYGYVMQVGRIVGEGPARDLLGSEVLSAAYLMDISDGTSKANGQ